VLGLLAYGKAFTVNPNGGNKLRIGRLLAYGKAFTVNPDGEVRGNEHGGACAYLRKPSPQVREGFPTYWLCVGVVG
jgi:hypothetical protein